MSDVTTSVDVKDFDKTRLPVAVELVGVDEKAVQVVTDRRPGTTTITAVADSAVAVTIADENAGRRGLVVVNTSTAVMFVKLGLGATDTDWTYRLEQYWTLELPQPCYTGDVSAVWASDAGGSANVTEIEA